MRATSKGAKTLVFHFLSVKEIGQNRKKKAEFSTGERTLTTKECLEKQRIRFKNYVSLGLSKCDCVCGSESRTECTGWSVQTERGGEGQEEQGKFF